MPENEQEGATPKPGETPAPVVPDAAQELADLRDKLEGQKKVNKDLEEKFKNAAQIARQKLEAEYQDKLNAGKSVDEQAIEAARAEARSEATKISDARILRAELKAAATSRLADPSDAALYIDLADFAVQPNGDVDSAALTAAVEDLIARKPHLAAPTNPFGGSGDGGATPPPKPTASVQERAAAALAAGDVRTSIALKASLLKPLPV
jgi:hypothetical protein